MDYEVPQDSKINIEESAHGSIFIIKPEKKWPMILFMSFWLCGWAVGESFAIISLISGIFGNTDEGSLGGFGQIFLIAWLGGWTVGGFVALKTLLWQIAGKEIITVNYESITIETDSVIYKKQKSYLKSYIKDLRLNPGSDSPFKQFNLGNKNDGKIAFDYGAKTIKFGVMEEDAEAKNVIKLILNKYPFYGVTKSN